MFKFGKNTRRKYDIIYLRNAKGTPQSAKKRTKEGITIRKRKIKITEEKIIQELARIAFDDISDYLSFFKDDNGETKIVVKESDGIDTRAVAEITNSKSGFRFKLYNKQQALVKLGDYLGLWKRTPEEEIEDLDELEILTP
ncbi:MAG: terminase small subunit [Clostridia bacterium]|nr:terminase small subunit [Clostridia bacterium]